MEAIRVNQKRYDGGMNQGGSSGSGKMWSDTRNIFKEEPTRFPNIGDERKKKRVKNASKAF